MAVFVFPQSGRGAGAWGGAQVFTCHTLHPNTSACLPAFSIPYHLRLHLPPMSWGGRRMGETLYPYSAATMLQSKGVTDSYITVQCAMLIVSPKTTFQSVLRSSWEVAWIGFPRQPSSGREGHLPTHPTVQNIGPESSVISPPCKAVSLHWSQEETHV